MEHSYIAGLIDSDGSISISRKNRREGMRNYRLVVQITWKQLDVCLEVLNELKDMYGGYVYTVKGSSYKPNNTYLKYFIDNKRAVKILNDLIPYLRIKKEQAKIGLKFAKIKEGRVFNRYHPHTEEDWKIENDLYEDVVSLNQKGRRK